MRRGDFRDIRVDGTTLRAEYLGKGRYATAWQVAGPTGRVYLFVKEGTCYMKEALLPMWVGEGSQRSPHLPEVKKHEDACVRGQWYDVYSMPYYRTLTAKDGEAWKQYRELLRANEQARKEILRSSWPCKLLSREGHTVNWRTIELADVPEPLKEGLEDLTNAIASFGCGCTLEFAPRNLGVDAEGRLILRDVAFDAEKIEQERAAVMKRAQAMRCW